MTQPEEWIGLSVSTIYEAAGREGLLGPGLSRVTKTARVVGGVLVLANAGRTTILVFT